ncbi:hypothetical protein RJT34_00433 [Clitoria ternatea]|uniref:PGG domain-containing protein n=1 Tax=Clitoria ternatea TaxID=43366 RepID=A0AAN9KI88_CLITE
MKMKLLLAFLSILLRLLPRLVDFNAIKKIKEKHVWVNQLLNILLIKPCDLDQPRPHHVVTFITPHEFQTMHGEISRHRELKRTESSEAKSKEKEASSQENNKMEPVEAKINSITQKEKNGSELCEQVKVDKMETSFLVAAKNGTLKILKKLHSTIHSCIHDTTSDGENVLLVAVKNRQPLVVEFLKNDLAEHQFDNLICGVDNQGNTALHLAAGAVNSKGKTWQIAGAAMQMTWDIKWYQYIKEMVPEHFVFRRNKCDRSAAEIFKETHKELLDESKEWMKDTSEACSIVAVLIAGACFMTASPVPVGTAEKSKLIFAGELAFDTFAMASLVGLCFSITALIMFLAILTSRKQAEDFRKRLPMKLLLGLSSLFVSIASMLVSFCSAHFYMLKDNYQHVLFPLYIATCLPVIFYAVVQFPLYFDLIRVMFKKVPQPSDKGDQL